MADEGSGRARGRGAKGRGRAQPREARPGTEQVQERAQPATAHPGPNGGGGRRTHRGAPRVDPPVPQHVEAVTQAMADVALSQETGGRGRSRRGYDTGDDNTRPAHINDKRGVSGQGILLFANFFKVLSKPQWVVFQYHCEFSPVVESSRMRRSFMREHKEKFENCFIFDGMSDLKTVTNIGESCEFFSQRRTDGENIRITLKRTAELPPNHPEIGRLFNVQMRRNLQHLKYQLLGRYFYDQNAVSEVPQYNLQIWQGVITSIRQQEEDIMMSVDTVHKVIRKETALEIITDIVRKSGNNYKEEASRELVGTIVMTRYNNKTYRVEDIDWSLNPTKTFESREGPLSYQDYYKKQYDINIRDNKQPLMLCTSKERELRGSAVQAKKIYLIPELCAMTGLTDNMRSNFSMMKELANHTKLDAATRVRNLTTFIKRVNQNENVAAEMNAWGLKFDDMLVKLQGRVVPSEEIIVARGTAKVSYDQRSGDFSKEIRGKHMYGSVDLKNWLVICTKFDEPKCNDFLTNLYRVCPPMGMKVSEPQVCIIDQDRIPKYLQAFRENINQYTQLVCFIVPNNKKERYDALKKHTYIDNAIPSQVIVARTLSKKPMLMSVATKVGIQLNCKLGGVPWALSIPFKVKIMVIGFDSYHDSSKKGRSAGAFVASLNNDCTKWYSKVSFHSAGGWEELSNHLQANFITALKKYHEKNNANPDLILFYRDGVGDGQIRYVRQWEIKQFLHVINTTLAGKPRYTFIIVNKRINARFFAAAGNSYNNPPPGTVVDNTVTRPDRYDFFLVSQSVRQGTVAPTMYNVIEDTSSCKPEHIQRMSYKMTHLYFNSQGTIRVPAPCQYAHKLAFLAGQSLHQCPNEELSDTLFYL